jgi:hypothetical protein
MSDSIAKPLEWRKIRDGFYVSDIRLGADRPRQWSIQRGPDRQWRGFWCGKFISAATKLSEQKSRLNAAAYNLCHERGEP